MDDIYLKNPIISVNILEFMIENENKYISNRSIV